MTWERVSRPGYFGRRRDEKVANYDKMYGAGKWRLSWVVNDESFPFVEACKRFYEESYFRYLKDRPEDLDYICSFTECIDNAMTNITSGLDYAKQESFSTHIQDIAVRNVLHRLGRKFAPKGNILIIRSKDSVGFRFGPGNIPFYDPQLITQPSLCPDWATTGSVEDLWQSNKWLEVQITPR